MTDATQTTELQLSDEFRQMKSLVERLAIESSIGTEDGFRTDVAAIMENILRAETEEEVFARQEAGTTASKDYVNRPFRLLPEDVTWKRTGAMYREQGAFPFYALMRVTDMETGDNLVINGGGATFVAVLDSLMRLGSFEAYREDGGRPLMVVEKPVASGFSVLLLKPVRIDTPRSTKRTSAAK